ncbi:limonene-1,2-epoxide hydrolase family protein [Rhodococcus sp. SGAir0479]|uniref:limonene-1,2-epoxide hydrolase family protein n=1 Tax=Rhodococcus sp. SGAir0479 TaxID=2567884 RepID=UPI0010CD2258|nr:limonene-1,2-epoxide hydrolase family protein [Rhodococcus sp. SGAir0479]QCQ92932.1 limonene-1,2-epoxide hydrolase [Rhodococcus sp. SGAir0479]
MSAAADLITEFCGRWADPDPAVIADYFTEDAVYHNIPMEPVKGRAAIEEFLGGFLAAFDGIDFRIHRQVEAGGIVMNERTDVLRGLGKETALPVMGVFEVVDGKIAAWRDYFDMGAITTAFGG